MRRIITLLILIPVFLPLNPVRAQPREQILYPELSRSGLHQLEYLSVELLKACPPEECVIAMIGRSPTLLSAWMDAHQFTNHLTLPVSGLKKLVLAKDLKTAEKRFSKQVLSTKLSPFIKPNVKRICVVDYVSRGQSLQTASHWVQRFLKQEHPGTSLQAIGFGEAPGKKVLLGFEKNQVPYRQIVNAVHLPPADAEVPGDLTYVTRKKPDVHSIYNEWNPLESKTAPTLKAPKSAYLSSDVATRTTYRYADYPELVAWFSNPELARQLPEHRTGRKITPVCPASFRETLSILTK